MRHPARVLDQRLDAAESRGVFFRLAAPRDAVERVLRLVGVDALIPCYPSVEQALTA
ncbi:STAS domain-containing protein [Streptomyces violaceoruber]